MTEKITLPLLPLRDPDLVVFPGQFCEIDVGRAFSLNAISKAKEADGKIVIAMQKDESIDDPKAKDFYGICSEAEIKRVTPIKNEDGTTMARVIIVGTRRGWLKVVGVYEETSCMYGEVESVNEPTFIIDDHIKDSIRQLRELILENLTGITLKDEPNVPVNSKELSSLLDEIAAQLPIIGKQKLKLLRARDPRKRLEEILTIVGELTKQSPISVEANPGEGDSDSVGNELIRLQKLIDAAKLPPEALTMANQEMRRLKMMTPHSSEFHVTLNYVEWLATLPWNVLTTDSLDIGKAQTCLDEDHFGLKKVKERIIEFLAVRKLAPDKMGTILCLVGPPGVGKAQPLNSKVLTPSGFINMGNVKVGTEVITPSGERAPVVGIFPQGVKDVYKIKFNDGTFARSCGEHLWKVRTRDDRRNNRSRVVSTESMIQNLYVEGGQGKNYSIDFVSPRLDFDDNITLDPYVVGITLSEGSPANNINKDNKSFVAKFIPNNYKFCSLINRERLLQGVLDGGGSPDTDSCAIEWSSTSYRFAMDMMNLVQSLGGQAFYTCEGEKLQGNDRHRLRITLPSEITPFLCERKAVIYNEQRAQKRVPGRYVESIELDGSEETQCILIDHPDHLYITDDFIATHNTSLGRSIAKAIGRKFVRLSLGGVHDEAEIRGHRRTYVGALPGKIIQNIKKVGSRNPVFMLDEIDKLSKDFRGDPASALLEVLDPEQNNSFTDNFLGTPFDLSDVMFIMTANEVAPIPAALYDRMEVIEIPGYSPFDKSRIAQQHLIPKQKEQYGLKEYDISISSNAVSRIVEEYTSEAGVRNLERQCGTIMRKIAVTVASGKDPISVVKVDAIPKFLGPPRVFAEKAVEHPEVGLSAGLAWSRHGGSLLFVETSLTRGKGDVLMTGNLGKVLQESARAAHTWIKSNAVKLGIDLNILSEHDVHIHLPAGATPKDGPSAGIAVAASMLSLFTNKPVRNDVAMTGEITLRGRVLPIGGLKEKVLAAHRAGIKEVIYPEQNTVDIEEIPTDVKNNIILTPVQNLFEALNILLVDGSDEPQPIVGTPSKGNQTLMNKENSRA